MTPEKPYWASGSIPPASHAVNRTGEKLLAAGPGAMAGPICRDGEKMTGSKHNHEGNGGEGSEPGLGPYWKRMHRD